MPAPPDERVSRKEKPVTCPYCDEKVPKPRAFDDLPDASGGRCKCGALFVADVTGKGGGQALMHGLTLLCAGDVDRALELNCGVDYEMTKVGYRPRTHSIEKRLPPGGAYGRPKLWFFRLLRGGSG